MIKEPHSNAIRQQAIDWLVRQQSGTFSISERRKFEQWLAADSSHRRVYEQVERAWRDLPCPQAELSVARKKTGRLRLLHHPLLLASAASVLLAVGLGVKEGWPLVDDSVFQTAKGELRQITLTDGSLVELNSDTELAVHYTWRGRSLELVRGEALFSVAPGKLRPFEVWAGGGKLRDIGTRFDVAIGPLANRISVLDGAINLSLPATGEQRQTEAGQMMTYNAATILSEPVAADIQTFAVWRNRKLIFRNTPLSEVVRELERYHPVHIRLADSSLNNLTLGGVFDSNDLERFLTTLEAVLPVEVKRDNNGDVLINHGLVMGME
jgi:transmembrane sensor